jgi:two-component system chemotaxis response regulator CheB
VRAFSHLRGPDREGITGVSCPECPGVLRLSEEGGRGFLVFRCRIGHAYSADELLRAKEERLECLQWAGITARDELAALLEDLATLVEDPDRHEVLRSRAAAVRVQIRALREMLESEVSLTRRPGRFA